MAVLFRASASATTGATPANLITVPKPTGVATGDAMRAIIYLRFAGGVNVTPPPGWGLVGSGINISGTSSLYVYERQGRAADPAAGWAWVFDDVHSAIGVIDAYYSDQASTYVRFCHHAFGATPSDVNHASIELQSNVGGQILLLGFAAPVQDSWTQDASLAEISDNTTTEGTTDCCLSTADIVLGGTGGSGVYTSTLDSAVAAQGVVHSCLVTEMGMSQSAGTGGLITIHDNALMDNATYYNLEELLASYPADVRSISAVITRPGYQLYGGANLSIGAASSPAETTWYERNTILNTGQRTLTTNASNLAYWSIDWERVFANHGTSMIVFYRGNLRLVDCHIDAAAALTIANGASSLVGIVQRCYLTHPDGTTGSLILGSSTFPLETVEDCNVFWEVGSSADACTGMFATVCRRLKFRSSSRAVFGANAANAFDMEDVIVEGAPTSVVRWGGSLANGWKFRNMTWPEGVPKFFVASSGNPTLANASLDGAKFHFKYEDLLGNAYVGKRLKVTDSIGNVVINAVSNSDGWIDFGSGKDVRNVWLADWYGVGLVETLRLRTPLKIEMNPVGDPSYDPSLESITYDEWEWPTTAPYTLSTGSFLPVTWVQPLGPPAAPAAAPSQITSDELDLPADGIDRILATVPSRS